MYYVTFCTQNRETLSPNAQTVVLTTCVALHDALWWLDSVVVMPDHVHLIATPYETTNIGIAVGRVKGRSAYDINRTLQRAGRLWQRDTFERIVRSEENLALKREYIFHNPVRKGLVTQWQDYKWLWWSGGLQPAENESGSSAG
jgi:REP element-mobilizing transposase RayT